MNLAGFPLIATLSAPGIGTFGVNLTATTETLNAILMLLMFIQGNPSRFYLLLLGTVTLTMSAITAGSILALQALLLRVPAVAAADLAHGQLELRLCLFVLGTVGCGLGRSLILAGITKHRPSRA